MNNVSGDDRIGFLIEYFEGYFMAILEGQEALAGLPAAVGQIQDDMAEVKGDIKVIKAVIKEHSGELKDHEKRIVKLEGVAV